jgi:hypothetical protein
MMTVGWFDWIALDSEHEAELANDPKQRESWIKLAKLAALWREDEAAMPSAPKDRQRGG